MYFSLFLILSTFGLTYQLNFYKHSLIYKNKNKNKNRNIFLNSFDNEWFDDDELDNEFGSEIENMIKKNNLFPSRNDKENKNENRNGEIGIRIFYPIGEPPEILKSVLKDNENRNRINKKSKNFELFFNEDFNFTNIGGYSLIKEELMQCADLLVNYTKYEKFNVRTPKGIILEGPPGNGKTILAKAFSGEIDIGFIPVSGSEFQEKYVGVGASRVRELFRFAKENIPCILFIDEIDALGRKRLSDGESSSSERDSTLNELLVALDGFKDTNGVFVIGATNRIDLLDGALIRPGRIDKKIYIGNPDRKTRKEVIEIHIKGKPTENISIEKLVEITNGFSCSEIENLLNEAMLYAIRCNREKMTNDDLSIISNRILTGWQINENKVSDETVKQIAIHEIGHALTSILIDYRKIIKVAINLWSPKALGFTLFDEPVDNILATKENLVKEIMVLLAGRIAEEIFYGDKVSAGANDDLNRVRMIIEKMVINYGMAENLFLSFNSEKFRERVDYQIEKIFNKAYYETKNLLISSKNIIKECSELLVKENEINEEQMKYIIDSN
jgi:cell division protease FtsH